jgi:hypothetical protein
MRRKPQFAEASPGLLDLPPLMSEAEPPPGHLGHRERLRQKLLAAGPDALAVTSCWSCCCSSPCSAATPSRSPAR